MPATIPTPHARDFLTLSGQLWGLSDDEIVKIGVEAWRRKSPVEQAALTTGLLSPVQVDIVGTLLRPEEIVPGYSLLSALGYGGMGVVYKARQERLDRIVAVKTVLVYHLTDPKTLVRFQQEAKVLARLQHPNIVQAFDYGQHEGRLYIVMEMVGGENLDHWIAARGRLAEFTAWSLARQAAAGLAHAASHGVVHRDIKPANMLVLEPPEGMSLPAGVPLLKLADFGLAVFHGGDSEPNMRLTSVNTAVGSPPYMSPEQLGGDPLDFHTDIYSLGAAVIHMLTGHAPFGGRTLARMLVEKQSDARTWLGESCPHLSTATADLLAWMMAPQPADRPTSYSALIAAIDRLDLPNDDDQSTQAVSFAPRSSTNTDHLGIDTHIDSPNPPLGPTREVPSAAPAKSPEAGGATWLNWRVSMVGVLLVVALAIGLYFGIHRDSGPRGTRRLTIGDASESLIPKNFALWSHLKGGWTTTGDDEGAAVAVGTNGFTQRALPPWKHYHLDGEVDLRAAPAAEIRFGFATGGEFFALRIAAGSDGERTAQLGRRAATGAPFQPIGVPRPLVANSSPYQAFELERQEQDWWVLVDNQLIGTLPLETSIDLPRVQLYAERDTAHFASLFGAELEEK